MEAVPGPGGDGERTGDARGRAAEGESLEFIEVMAADIELATKLMADVLDRDEVPPVTGNVLTKLTTFVNDKAAAAGISVSDVRFTQREIREHTGIGYTQLKSHLRRLVELEHVVVHGGRGRRGHVYELASTYDGKWSGENQNGRPTVGHLSEAKADTPGIRDHEGKGAFQPNGRPSGVHVNGAVDNPGRT